MKHTLKLQEQFADEVLLGLKTFEIRNNDRDFHVGDYIKFHIVNSNGDSVSYHHQLEDKLYVITYVLQGWGLQPGYAALGIRQCKALNDVDEYLENMR